MFLLFWINYTSDLAAVVSFGYFFTCCIIKITFSLIDAHWTAALPWSKRLTWYFLTASEILNLRISLGVAFSKEKTLLTISLVFWSSASEKLFLYLRWGKTLQVMRINVVTFEEIFLDLFFLCEGIVFDFISERLGTFEPNGEIADNWRCQPGNHCYLRVKLKRNIIKINFRFLIDWFSLEIINLVENAKR